MAREEVDVTEEIDGQDARGGDDALAFRSATSLLATLEAGEVSAVELLDLYLARIEGHGDRLNAVVTLDAEGARAAARDSDRARARGDRLGPLHGLPMTIKDSFQTAGMRTTCGAPELSEFVPDRDATAVARLRDAGAILFGKSNVPLWTAESQTFNAVFGTTNNPWDVRHAPGASSGGAAAALAAGECALELGSDIAGSIRYPAHCCGVVGLRPSFGIIPQNGYIDGPRGWETDTDMSAIGPMARDVDDLELELGVLAGPSAAEATAWRLELPPPRRADGSGYRMAVTIDDPNCPVASDYLAVLRRAVDALADGGLQVEERPLPVDAATVDDLFSRMLAAATCPRPSDEEFAELQRLARESAAADASVEVRRARAFTQTHRDWHAAVERRTVLRAEWAAFFADYDVLLCPVTLTAAPAHSHADGITARMALGIEVDGRTRTGWEALFWSSLSTVGALPAASVPIGRTADGLPVGIQIVGPYLEDRTVLDAARRIQRIAGGFVPPPGL